MEILDVNEIRTFEFLVLKEEIHGYAGMEIDSSYFKCIKL